MVLRKPNGTRPPNVSGNKRGQTSQKKTFRWTKMETNQLKLNPKTSRLLPFLKLIARIALIISSTLLATSITFLLVYGQECYNVNADVPPDIIWPTIIMTFYSLFYS